VIECERERGERSGGRKIGQRWGARQQMGVWEKGHVSARAKALEIAGAGRRESTRLSHKQKRELVWRVSQRRANASASRTGKVQLFGKNVSRGRPFAWYAQGKNKRKCMRRNTLHACRPRIRAIRHRPVARRSSRALWQVFVSTRPSKTDPSGMQNTRFNPSHPEREWNKVLLPRSKRN